MYPKHTFENIIYTQTLRYRTITTDDKVLKTQLINLKNILTKRGYPNKLINQTFNKIKYITQKDCLHGNTKSKILNKHTPNKNRYKTQKTFETLNKHTSNKHTSNKGKINFTSKVKSHYEPKNSSKKPLNSIENKGSETTLPFIIPFYKNVNPINNILRKHWRLIETDPELKNIMPNKPFIVYKRHKNLKEFLIRTYFSSKPEQHE